MLGRFCLSLRIKKSDQLHKAVVMMNEWWWNKRVRDQLFKTNNNCLQCYNCATGIDRHSLNSISIQCVVLSFPSKYSEIAIFPLSSNQWNQTSQINESGEWNEKKNKYCGELNRIWSRLTESIYKTLHVKWKNSVSSLSGCVESEQ